MSKQIPWLRVFVEGAVIVGSILLAFVIDAAWDQRNQRVEVRLELQNVADELAENREQVLWQLDLLKRMADGGNAMLQIMESSDQSSVTAVPDTLVFLATSAGATLDASLGAINALIASGRLAAVEDLDVRRKLAGISDAFEDARENQIRGIELSDTQIRPATYPYLNNKAANRVATLLYSEFPMSPDLPLTHETVVAFPNNMITRGLIGFRNTLFSTTVPEMEGLLVELDELLDLLRRAN